MSAAILRKEIHAYVDTIPEYKLKALKLLLADFAEPEFIIETDLTDEEREIIAEGRKELKEHPENFEEAESFFASLGLSYADALDTVRRRISADGF